MFFEVVGEDNAGTRYYYDVAAVSIEGDIATVDVVSTYPEGELSNVINNKISGASMYLDRTIMLNLKEKKFKCTHYTAMSSEVETADEECDSGWKKIEKDSPVFHLLKVVQLRN